MEGLFGTLKPAFFCLAKFASINGAGERLRPCIQCDGHKRVRFTSKGLTPGTLPNTVL